MEDFKDSHPGEADFGYVKTENYNQKTTERLSQLYAEVLTLIGEDGCREGLVKTPLRVAKSMQFLTQGYNVDGHKILMSARFKEKYQEMVIVKDIEIFSMCEHHLMPFFGKAHVAYIPNGQIVGISKLARVEAYSRRLQVQERLTMQIRDCIQETLEPLGVAVIIEAKHMCMVMRGVQKQNSVTTTSAFTGEFMHNLATREEFVHIIGTNLH